MRRCWCACTLLGAMRAERCGGGPRTTSLTGMIRQPTPDPTLDAVVRKLPKALAGRAVDTHPNADTRARGARPQSDEARHSPNRRSRPPSPRANPDRQATRVKAAGIRSLVTTFDDRFQTCHGRSSSTAS